jgi:DNA-binding NarL/FixJ family response regulator
VPGAGPDPLSDRERVVPGHLSRGPSNAESRDTLVASLPPVKTHVANLLVRLGLRDRVQAAIYAHEQGVRSDW